MMSSAAGPSRFGLRIGLERHFWRVNGRHFWRCLRLRVPHLANACFGPAHFVWWCHCAMMVSFQMDSFEIPEGDAKAAQAVTFVLGLALAKRLGIEPGELVGSMIRVSGGRYSPAEWRWAEDHPFVDQILPEVGHLLIGIIEQPENSHARIKRLIGIGKDIVRG